MKPQYKTMALTFALILPYLGLVTYISAKNGDAPFPTWFPYFGLSYILGTILLVSAYSRRIRRNAAPGLLEKPRPGAQRISLVWGSYLIVVWSGLFIWGTYKTIIGEFDWRTSVPAGAFLLVFIGLFSSSIYKMRRSAAQNTTSTTQQSSGNAGDSTTH